MPNQNVKIPKCLSQHLSKGDNALQTAVNQSLGNFQVWLNAPMPFFPDFTDHGLPHLTRVLNLAGVLIPGKVGTGAWKVLSPADAACLILAVVVHDAAMHLTPESFLMIVRGQALKEPIKPFDDRTWPDLWTGFLIEARRWDDSQHKIVFGNEKEFKRRDGKTARVEDLPYNHKIWDDYDNRLAGEFIRRHHTRLAHEFALHGVPGPGGGLKLSVPDGFDRLGDLAGLVARSHGMALREALRYFDLEDRGEWIRSYRNVHAVFLMALLRVADYLDLYAERAAKGILKVRSISRYAAIEWSAHASIKGIEFKEPDDETVKITAEPMDADSFLKVRDWLNGIQHELDRSFAVLGEVYQHDPKYRKLGLSIRRIRSNLDDIDRFASRADVKYIPCPAAFKAADADLLKLLIKPLYGDSPDIGIRELLQNAVDAVRELDLIRQDRAKAGQPIDESEIATFGGADVLIHLRSRGVDLPVDPLVPDDWEHWLEVHDCGIGMDADIIRHYFLTAGATYRSSEAWLRQFADKETGASRVTRSGRFGIGALATFLLGEEFVLSTRLFGLEPGCGISFHCHLTDRNIQLMCHERAVGTTVCARLDASVSERLRRNSGPCIRSAMGWDWYCSALPKVVRWIDGEPIEQKWTKADTDRHWRHVNHAAFREITWSYSWLPNQSMRAFAPFGRAPSLVVNGIGVTSDEIRHPLEAVPYCRPTVCVVDPDGNVPLELKRKALAEPEPYAEELARDQVRDFIAELLALAPRVPDWDWLRKRHAGAILRERLVMFEPYLLWTAGLRVALGVQAVGSDDRLNIIRSLSGICSLLMTEVQLLSTGDYGRVELDHQYPADRVFWHKLAVGGSRLFIGMKAASDDVDDMLYGWGRYVDGGWRENGNCIAPQEGLLGFGELSEVLPEHAVVIEWTFSEEEPDHSLFSHIWLDELGLPPTLPLDPKLREQECASAYDELAEYIVRHRLI